MFKLYKSENAVDKARCKEIQKELAEISKVQAMVDKYTAKENLEDLIKNIKIEKTIKKEREELER